jgi:hypothetical protein
MILEQQWRPWFFKNSKNQTIVGLDSSKKIPNERIIDPN